MRVFIVQLNTWFKFMIKMRKDTAGQTALTSEGIVQELIDDLIFQCLRTVFFHKKRAS